MAKRNYDDLDDEDYEEELPASIQVAAPPPPRQRFNFRPLLTGLLVLGLGGGLGAGIYVLTSYDARALIGLLDIGDDGPRLSLQLPGVSESSRSNPANGGLLTPPGGPAPGKDELLQSQTPPEELAAATPPVAQSAIAPSTTTPLPSPSAAPTAAPAPVAAPTTAARSAAKTDPIASPPQPTPRTADKPPSFDALPEIKGDLKPLPSAPLREMLRKSQTGEMLPTPSADGRQPWQVYARPWGDPANRGKVAVVVIDLGLDRVATEAAISRLPPEVTLAFSPYAANLEKWIRKARDHGHEVLMVVPSESEGPNAPDPGPYGLISSATPEANQTRLETVMARGPGAAGLVLLGESFAASPQISGVQATVREHGLLFVGPGAAAPARTPALARVTAIIDRDLYREAIDLRLNQIAVTARVQGRAVAVVQPRPLSFERVVGWIGTLTTNGVVLTPVSALVAPPPPAKP
ncbi:divergent polysaccharide deacetylase family protein [Magnetospirillum molischianum]|uniref:Skin secretory protein xP2 n=1 Tax=Magnetospirillum molischianum DSM 120 TaxID=1150626 RepID=H8FT31_MAGML|nr:divergent polysaccharide deacetylase family protein [Magnetospirillum molischianum]CCG41519.1 Skin secretory protein xP2 [Magnetospirillum molischianum DSM 120]